MEKKIVKLTLSKEAYDELDALAKENHQSIQDYIRSKVFGESIFTVDEAVKRILAGDFDNPALYPDGFELPDVYGDDWTIPRGQAGVFGKNFFKFVQNNQHLGIKFKDMGKYGRRATYILERR